MTFNEQVYEVVKRIPKGRVATYGQIAAMIGKPRAARAVGWSMHQLDRLPPRKAREYPWWRVINAKGMISTTCREHTADTQKELLVRDGVEVVRKDEMWWVDLREYLWNG